MNKTFAPILPVILVTLIIAALGCSGKDPVSTKSNLLVIPDNETPLVLISDRAENGSPSGGTGLLGVFHVMVDSDGKDVQISPYRIASGSQDVLEVVDITNFMLMTPCLDCVKIESISMNDNSNVVLSIGIKHPFRAPDLSQPPTAQNRADLHVFNVEGIVYTIGDNSDLINFSTMAKNSYPPILVNADGYTSYLSNSLGMIQESDADIHPYILHFADFTSGNFSKDNEFGFADIRNPMGYLVMKQGSGWDFREYEFDLNSLSSGGFEFLYAIGCTFGISAANRWARLTPVYRLPQFNKKAATKVWVSDMIENPPAGLQGGLTASSNTMEISVVDVNHQITLGNDLNQMRFSSDIESITIEIPSILSGVIHMDSPIPTGGDPRNPNDPLTYSFTIHNELSAPEGSYTGLIRVKDSYPVSSNTDFSGDGIERVEPFADPTIGLFDIPEFATYCVFTIDVGIPNLPPVACFDYTPDHFNPIEYLPVKFDGSCSYDDDGDVILYEWDFDYDGAVFNIHDSGVVVEHAFPAFRDYTVALRVSDDGTPQMSNISTRNITVEEFIPVEFEPNIELLTGIRNDGFPVGLHYTDSREDSIYVTFSDSNNDVKCLRSDDGGDSFVTPAHTVNPIAVVGDLIGIGTRITESGNADIAWLEIPGFTGRIGHAKAETGYNFDIPSLVDSPDFPFVLSHDVSSDDTIFIVIVFLYTDEGSPPVSYFEAGLYVSADGGVSWNPDNNGKPILISESCGDNPESNVASVTITADEIGNAHIFYIDHLASEIRYTKASNNAASFTTFKTVATLTPPIDLPFHSLSADVTDDGQNIYLAYKNGSDSDIYLVKSHDGGDTFSSPIMISDIAGVNDHPCLTIDPYGWLYVVYLDKTSDDVRFTYSTDKGENWAESIIINDDDDPEVKHHAPTITVDSELRIHVFWRDSRNAANPGSPAQGDYSLFYSRGIWN